MGKKEPMVPSLPSSKLNWRDDVNEGTPGTCITNLEALEQEQPLVTEMTNRAKIVNTTGNSENAQEERVAPIDTTMLTQIKIIDKGHNQETETVVENHPEMGEEIRLAEIHLVETPLAETHPDNGEIRHAERHEEILQEEIHQGKVHHLVILRKEVVVREARQRTESHPGTVRKTENPRIFVGFI